MCWCVGWSADSGGISDLRFMTRSYQKLHKFITCELRLNVDYWDEELEQTYKAGRDKYEDGKCIPLRVSNCVGLEGDGGPSFTASQLKMELEKMIGELPLDFDFKQANQKCTQKCCVDSAERRSFASLGVFCRTESLFNIPVNLRSLNLFFESLKLQKRTEGMSGCAAGSSGNVIFSSSGQWMSDSIEGTVMATTLLKSSLLLQLGPLDNAASQLRSRSVNPRKTKSSELSSYPSGRCDLRKPISEVTTSRKQRSESNIFEKMLVSGSSEDLKHSHQSTSSAHRTVAKGMLRCVQKSGVPYFVFSLHDDRDEVYVANYQKIEPSEDKALDYMYLFRSRTDGKRESRNGDINALSFVGKMKVSSSLVLNSSQSKFLETEFVLFGAHGDLSREMQSSTSTATKSKGLSKMIAKMFRSTLSFKRKSTKTISKLSFRFEDFLPETPVGELSDIDKFGPMDHLAHDFAPNLELAAIVVNDCQPYSNKEVAVGGWGLKFLEKVEVDLTDTSPESSFASEGCEESCVRYRRESCRHMNVLIPFGFHGGPVTRIGGPSSLTDRWRSGGHCDCGGWDIGCPLTLLNNNSICSDASPQVELQEDCKSVNLFIEGANLGEPILKMVNMNEGLYFIYFQSNLSALQSFSIGVAIIHTQTPDLYPKL